MSEVSPLTKISARLDSWMSALTGIGGAKDKRNSYQFKGQPALDFRLAEDLFNSNDLAAKVCEVFPEDALAGGFEIKCSVGDKKSDGGAKLETKLQERSKQLGVRKQLTDVAVWGRVHGDSALFTGVEDGLQSFEPLDLKRVKRIAFLRRVTRQYLSVAKRYSDPNLPNYNEPELYNVTGVAGALVVHESRLIMFRGARTSEEELRRNGGWHFSVLHRGQQILRDFGISWDAAALLLQNSTQGVFQLEGLIDALASDDGQKLLEARIEIMDMCRSVLKSIALDTKETFTYQTASFAGIPELLDRMATRIAAAFGIPVTVLFGEAPAGLNATGDADLKSWHKRVDAYRENELREPLERIVELLIAEQGTAPASWSVEFCKLDKPTEAQTAELRFKVAQTDQIYVNLQTIQPEEIAVNRFTPEGWSMDTVLDLTVRQAIIDEAHKETQPDASLQGTVGARSTALLEVLDKVATKAIPRETGVTMLVNVFGMTEGQAEEQMGVVGKSFFKDPPEVANAGAGNPDSSAAPKGAGAAAAQAGKDAPPNGGAKPRQLSK